MSWLESDAGITKTKLIHAIAGRRHLTNDEAIDILAALQRFLSQYVQCANEIGEMINNGDKTTGR